MFERFTIKYMTQNSKYTYRYILRYKKLEADVGKLDNLINYASVQSDRCAIRVPTGIPGYGLRMEMIRKFFPFPLWKRFRKSGIPERFPERFFSVNRKFPERCSGIPDRYGIQFRKFSGKIVPEISGTIGTRIKASQTYVKTTPVAVSATTK